MEVVVVDDGQQNGRAAQMLDGVEAAEACSHHDHVGPGFGLLA